MHYFDVAWKLIVLFMLLSIGGSLGMMAQALKSQAEAFAASLQQDEG